MTREQKLALIYRHTHRDFRGESRALGGKAIMILRDCGTCLVSLDSLTDAEIESRLPYALKREAERKVRS